MSSYAFQHHHNCLSSELCSSLRTYFDASPTSAHLGMRQEGENVHLPSMRLDITDKRSLKLVGIPLRTKVHEAVAKECDAFFDGAYRFKRFTVRRYSPSDRDSCDWHVDACDLSFVIFVGGNCSEGDGGDLVLGDGPTPDRIVSRALQTEGSMVVFEGRKVMHMVEPVLSGVRYTVVLFVDKKHLRSCNK